MSNIRNLSRMGFWTFRKRSGGRFCQNFVEQKRTGKDLICIHFYSILAEHLNKVAKAHYSTWNQIHKSRTGNEYYRLKQVSYNGKRSFVGLLSKFLSNKNCNWSKKLFTVTVCFYNIINVRQTSLQGNQFIWFSLQFSKAFG